MRTMDRTTRTPLEGDLALSERVVRCPVCQAPVVMYAGRVVCPSCGHVLEIPVVPEPDPAWESAPDGCRGCGIHLGDRLRRFHVGLCDDCRQQAEPQRRLWPQ